MPQGLGFATTDLAITDSFFPTTTDSHPLSVAYKLRV
jgi:hypothetical protein